MKLKTRELPARLKQGPLPAAILLFGQDRGLIERAAESVRQTVPEAVASEFDHEVFFAGDLDEERFLNSCRGFPLFAPQRLVHLKEADRLTPAARTTVIDYLKTAVADTLLLVTADNLEAGNPLRRRFESDKKSWCVPFYPLEGGELRNWIRYQLTSQGFSVDNDALIPLTERLGGDTGAADRELEKLILFMGEERRIGLEEVMAVIGETTNHSAFALAAAVTAGHSGEALYMVQRLLQSGEEPLALLGVLTNRLRRLVRAAERLAAGDHPKKVAKELQIFWKEQALFFDQCQSIPPRLIADALLHCLGADGDLKSGVDPGRTLERLIMRLAGRFRRRPGSGFSGR